MRLAVFASGNGSNFGALLDAIAEGRLPATAVLLVADRPGTGAAVRAVEAGVPAVVIAPREYPDEDAFGEALCTELSRHGSDFIALAGYLKRIPPAVLAAFPQRVLNIHPALLPAFGGHGLYGRRVHEAVLAHGCRWTGVTVHLVDAEYDTGAIVLQRPVPVLPVDTAASLAARVLTVEHALYPEAVRLFAEGRIRIEGRRVCIDGDIAGLDS